MDGVAGYLLHVGMTALLVYTGSKLCFRFLGEFKQMSLRTGIFLILTPQKFQQERKTCLRSVCSGLHLCLGLF